MTAEFNQTVTAVTVLAGLILFVLPSWVVAAVLLSKNKKEAAFIAKNYQACLEELTKLRKFRDAVCRLKKGNYLKWESVGGPNECVHGVAAGIPCQQCDEGIVKVSCINE